MDADADALDLEALAVAAVDALEELGGRVVALHRREVHLRPGDEVIVGFDATVRWPNGTARDELVHVAVPLADRAATPQVWCYPHDPLLPGLADAVTPDNVGAFLGLPVGAVRLTVRSLRPCRRAVVEVGADNLDVHLKVVPPDQVLRVVGRHRAFAAAGLPVPPVVTVDDQRGWVVMATLRGTTLDALLDEPTSLRPGAADIAAVIERIADVELADADLVPASTAAELIGRHAAVIATAQPELGDRAAALVHAIESGARSTTERMATVHGDLHAGQLLIDAAGGIVGLLDLDDSGRGDVLDEHARLLAHLVAAAALAGPTHAAHRWSVASELADDLVARLGGHELAPRVAASLLGWATAPWRAQDASWPERVEALLAITEDVLARGVDAAIRSRRSP